MAHSIRINIRMNIDRFNYMDYPGLKRLIDSFDGFEIALYPSVLENLNERKLKRIKYYMNHRDYEDFIIDSHNSGGLEDGGLDIIDNRRYFCVAELENSYVVDEKGNFYKCWDDIGNEKSICFNIYDKDNIDLPSCQIWVLTFTDPLCKKCKFLPLCFGGCKFQKNTMHKKVYNFSDESCVFL